LRVRTGADAERGDHQTDSDEEFWHFHRLILFRPGTRA
jgi:hypothetical protein